MRIAVSWWSGSRFAVGSSSEHDGRLLGEGARQVHALQLARRERAQRAVGQRHGVGRGERPFDRGDVREARRAEEPLVGDAPERHDVAHAQGEVGRPSNAPPS